METINNAAVAALITGLICAVFGLQGCGVSYSGFTLGTTGYMAEVNKGKALELGRITEKDRKELDKLINGEK